MKRFVLIIAVLLGGPAAAQESPAYRIDIEPGVEPKMSPMAVSQRALENLSRPFDVGSLSPDHRTAYVSPKAPRVRSLKCTTADKLWEAYHAGQRDRRVLWWVDAEGEFVNYRTGSGLVTVHDEGFLVIDDATQMIVGVGSLTPARAVIDIQSVKNADSPQ